jgi:hypothetical protein
MFATQRSLSAANTGDANSAAVMNNPAIAECFMGDLLAHEGSVLPAEEAAGRGGYKPVHRA